MISVFPATTAAAALASFGDLLGEEEAAAVELLLAMTFVVEALPITPTATEGVEEMFVCCFCETDDIGVGALEKRLIPVVELIEDLCCCTMAGSFDDPVSTVVGVAAALLVGDGLDGRFSVILLSADGEGKFVSLLIVLTDALLSQLMPELTDLPLLKPLELDVLFPNPLIWLCLLAAIFCCTPF